MVVNVGFTKNPLQPTAEAQINNVAKIASFCNLPLLNILKAPGTSALTSLAATLHRNCNRAEMKEFRDMHLRAEHKFTALNKKNGILR